jgi:hypothetical protein
MQEPAFMDGVTELARMAANYAHSCQVEDGGYFFARIPPGSLRDTYFAVRILHMLNEGPRRIGDLKDFLRSSLREQTNKDAHALYLFNETLGLLGEDSGLLRPAVEGLSESSENLAAAADLDGLYLEVVSELEQVLELVSLLQSFHLSFDRARIMDFVLSLQNSDGGFGGQGISTLATTHYAVRILSMLEHHFNERDRILAFLKVRERDVYFLEDLYYLETARSILDESVLDADRVVSFVMGCQRPGGGFARARPMGIPTLEYTHYAISTLKLLGAL